MSALSYLLPMPLSAETSILVFGKSCADQCYSMLLESYVRVIFALGYYLLNDYLYAVVHYLRLCFQVELSLGRVFVYLLDQH